MLKLSSLLTNPWVRYAVTAVLLTLIVLKVHPERVFNAVGSANLVYLVLALALTLPFLYLKVVRWHVMLEVAGIRATFSEATFSLIAGMGFALVTPARLGEIVRGAYLRDSQKLKIAGLVLVDKAFDVLVLVILSAAGAWTTIGWWAGAGLLCAALVGLLVVYRPREAHARARRISSRLPGTAKIDSVLSGLEALSPATTTFFLALTALSFAVVLLQFGLILLSWRSWSPDIVFLTFPLVVLTNVLPITIGGLGVREGAAVLLLGHYGVSPAHAALAAFLMFTVNTALPGLIGAALTPAVKLTSPTPGINPEPP